jgi:hypothetical protein
VISTGHNLAAQSPMSDSKSAMLQEFFGCDGGDPGSPTSPSLWLFGIEPGNSIYDQKSPALDRQKIAAPKYSIDLQKIWPFNKKAFKLLSVVYGYELKQYMEFAEKHRPFEEGCTGFFKGNIYPIPCRDIGTWHQGAGLAAGFQSKSDYRNWCRENRFPVIRSWVEKFRPSTIIACGLGNATDFSLAFFGHVPQVEEQTFRVNNYQKRVLSTSYEGTALIVVPHLSGGQGGLNSDEACRLVGEYIKNLVKPDQAMAHSYKAS